MRIVIRVDASLEIGSGHAMRCLTLANTLRDGGAETTFIMRAHTKNLNELVRSRGFRVIELAMPATNATTSNHLAHSGWLGVESIVDAEETALAISRIPGQVDWLIIDHYGIDERWQKMLRKSAQRIMVIDDLADRNHDCDLLLDQNLVADLNTRYLGKIAESTVQLLGPKYALLQSQYANARKNSLKNDPVCRILVYFGAVDRGLTSLVLNAFADLERSDIMLDVVVSSDNDWTIELQSMIAAHTNIRLHHNLPSLATLMAEADLAIGGAGATSWERLCLNLPALVVTLADNQLPIAAELHRRGFARWLGNYEDITVDGMRRAILDMISNKYFSFPLFEMRELVDGLGVCRLHKLLLEPFQS